MVKNWCPSVPPPSTFWAVFLELNYESRLLYLIRKLCNNKIEQHIYSVSYQAVWESKSKIKLGVGSPDFCMTLGSPPTSPGPVFLRDCIISKNPSTTKCI